MRRILPLFVGCLFVVASAFAQRGGGGHGGGGGMRGGGGGGFHGGGVAAGRVGGGGFRGGNFGGFRGNFNRGFRGYSTFGYYGYPYYGALWWDPFWWDWWDDNGYTEPSYPYYQQPYPYDGGYGGYGAGSPPVVIISNTPAGVPQPPPAPVVREYPPPSTTSAPQVSKYEEPLYLLAFHDGMIRAVLAYWVQGTTVHYVTMDHKEVQTPLTSLDRELSDRLNRERNVTFSLPG